MDYSHEQHHSQDERDKPRYYQQHSHHDISGPRSWSEGSFVFQNGASALLDSPTLIKGYPSTLIDDGSWQTEPVDLSQDINGFLNLRRTNNAPWTGQQRLMSQDQLWSHSFPGATAPMSDPGQDFYQRNEFNNNGSIMTATDSAYVSFDASGGPSGYPVPNLTFDDSMVMFQSDSMQLQDYIMRPQQAESVVSDPLNSGGYRASHVRNRPHHRNKIQIPPCGICHKVLKNQSDALKHHFTHTKPFKCEVAGCSRYEGFATQNDLQRHRKAVHRLQPTVGRKTGYVCVACAQVSNGSPPKFWPRRDNFKAHVNRKHRDWNEQTLLERSELPKPLGAITESGYVSAPSQMDPFDNPYNEHLASPLEMGFPGPSSQQGEYPPFDLNAESKDDELAGVGAGTSADPSLGNRATDTGLHVSGGNGRHGLSVLSDAAASFDRLAEQEADYDLFDSADKYHGISNLHISQPDLIVKVWKTRDWTDPSGESSMHTTPITEPLETQSKHPDGDFVCETCAKRKKRECDLRKHMKRHTRPYGCTFRGCSKRFGSRNDWKRHENSQHALQERYYCEMIRPDGRQCNQPYDQRERFLAHLRGPAHRIPPGEVELTGESMREGRNGHNRFWCGFCKKLIPSDGEVQGAWDFRFQHIGDHFDKDHLEIDSWLCSEEGRSKGEIARGDTATLKMRPLSGGFEEDSDLGDDGIPQPAYILSTTVKETELDVDADHISDYDVHVLRSKMDWKRG